MTYQLIQCGSNHKPNEGVVVASYETHEEFEADWPDELIAGTRLKCCWVSSEAPESIKQWSETAKGSARRKRLRRRLEDKHPLLANVLYKEQVLADREYFEGRTHRRKTQ